MALLHAVTLSNPDKLATLRRLDQFRLWYSLDDKRFCLCCSEIITGHDVQVIGGTRGTGPLRIVCPTESCPAIPMDWILPTEEILNRRRRALATIDGDISSRVGI
jgi:hypothetical protein